MFGQRSKVKGQRSKGRGILDRKPRRRRSAECPTAGFIASRPALAVAASRNGADARNGLADTGCACAERAGIADGDESLALADSLHRARQQLNAMNPRPREPSPDCPIRIALSAPPAFPDSRASTPLPEYSVTPSLTYSDTVGREPNANKPALSRKELRGAKGRNP